MRTHCRYNHEFRRLQYSMNIRTCPSSKHIQLLLFVHILYVCMYVLHRGSHDHLGIAVLLHPRRNLPHTSHTVVLWHCWCRLDTLLKKCCRTLEQRDQCSHCNHKTCKGLLVGCHGNHHRTGYTTTQCIHGYKCTVESHLQGLYN